MKNPENDPIAVALALLQRLAEACERLADLQENQPLESGGVIELTRLARRWGYEVGENGRLDGLEQMLAKEGIPFTKLGGKRVKLVAVRDICEKMEGSDAK